MNNHPRNILVVLFVLLLGSNYSWSQGDKQLTDEDLTTGRWKANQLLWGLNERDTLILMRTDGKPDIKFKRNHSVKNKGLKVGFESPVKVVWEKSGSWSLSQDSHQKLLFDFNIRKIELELMRIESDQLVFLVKGVKE